MNTLSLTLFLASSAHLWGGSEPAWAATQRTHSLPLSTAALLPTLGGTLPSNVLSKAHDTGQMGGTGPDSCRWNPGLGL